MLVLVAVIATVVIRRHQPVEVVRRPIDPVTGRATGRALPTKVAYSQLPAGRGLPWADDVQREHAELDLRPGPVGNYGVADYSGTYINVRNGERRTTAAPSCDCRPIRVWFTGGSAAFGSGQRDGHTIASDLVRLAAAGGTTAEVHNIAVPAWTLWQEYQGVLARLATGEAPPDLVVFYDGFNDTMYQLAEAVEQRGPVPQPVVGPDAAFDRFVDGSVPDVDGAVQALGGSDALAGSIAERYLRLVSVIRSHLEGDGIAVEFVLQPDSAASERQRRAGWTRSWDTAVRGTNAVLAADVLESVASKVSAEAPAVHDLRHALDGVREPVFIDLVHTNEVGAQAAARAVHDAIGPRLRELRHGER